MYNLPDVLLASVIYSNANLFSITSCNEYSLNTVCFRIKYHVRCVGETYGNRFFLQSHSTSDCLMYNLDPPKSHLYQEIQSLFTLKSTTEISVTICIISRQLPLRTDKSDCMCGSRWRRTLNFHPSLGASVNVQSYERNKEEDDRTALPI